MQSEEIEFRKLLGFFISFFPISPNSICYCYFEYRFVSSIRITASVRQAELGVALGETIFLCEFLIHFNLLKFFWPNPVQSFTRFRQFGPKYFEFWISLFAREKSGNFKKITVIIYPDAIGIYNLEVKKWHWFCNSIYENPLGLLAFLHSTKVDRFEENFASMIFHSICKRKGSINSTTFYSQ